MLLQLSGIGLTMGSAPGKRVEAKVATEIIASSTSEHDAHRDRIIVITQSHDTDPPGANSLLCKDL
jgi:hypothetical protein